ncbi:MAG: ABC transporter ATP-binding protein [Chloroflexi bacterium]|nr:ABC transporter ATP-binding protein [Chloroflexota bacterium]
MKNESTSPQVPALEARRLSVALGGVEVINVPSLEVHPSEVLVVIGPNGSGKSTLLLSLALLLKPTKGSISYNGVAVEGDRAALRLRRRLAVVFQQPLLLDSSVRRNVTLGMQLRGVRKKEMESRADKWLERFGVSALKGRQARNLSGGEAQRVSLARAFALEPEVLFLDEPFSSLDAPTRQALTDEFEAILRETRVTTVMVTHDRNEALALADRVVVLMRGHIRQTGTPGEVFASPVDEDVAGFVGVENILSGRVESQSGGMASVVVSGQHIDSVSSLPTQSDATVCLRPEDITLSPETSRPGATSARNHLSGHVVRAMPMGAQVRVTVDCGVQLIALVTRRSYEDLHLEVDRPIVASFKASSVHLIPRR